MSIGVSVSDVGTVECTDVSVVNAEIVLSKDVSMVIFGAVVFNEDSVVNIGSRVFNGVSVIEVGNVGLSVFDFGYVVFKAVSVIAGSEQKIHQNIPVVGANPEVDVEL